MCSENEMHAVDLARKILANGIYIQRMLGGKGLVGMTLIEAHFAGDPWLTVQQIADKSTMSDDTVRRRLATLVKLGRVKEKEDLGRKLYAVNPTIAKQIMARICERETVPVKVP